MAGPKVLAQDMLHGIHWGDFGNRDFGRVVQCNNRSVEYGVYAPMKEVHYFQRYTQKENWLTNSTLLLFNRLYLSSVLKFRDFVRNLSQASSVEVQFGITFGQQYHSEASVPDGLIRQESVEILIETKLHDSLRSDQLINHLSAFGPNASQRILLGLSKYPADSETVKAVVAEIKKNRDFRGVEFVSVTFDDVERAFREVLSDADTELAEMLNDYYALCAEENLIDKREQTMLAVTAGMSIAENLKYDIYYDPAERRNNQPFKYLGLYENKSIAAIGAVRKIVPCDLIDGKLVINDDSKLDPGEIQRITQIIETTDYYDISEGSKFYLVDKFFPTDFRKTSPGSMRGKNYFDLEIFVDLDDDVTAEMLSHMLAHVTWE